MSESISQLKQNIINGIIDRESGYVNDKDDSGGETNYGITIEVARQNGYAGEMIDLSRSTAFEIYSKKYWDKLKLDEIAKLSLVIAEELADTGVNMGTNRAARFLQRSLNVLNNREQFYEDLIVDGLIGRKTIVNLKVYFAIRGNDGETILHRMLNSLQGAFYIRLSERRQKDERFIFGWFRNRVA